MELDSSNKIVGKFRTGGTYDSEGQFSLSHKALDKLASYNLPDPSFWILKLVQAAVAAGADGIQIKQQRKATLIRFRTRKAFELSTLLQSLTSVDSASDRATQHLSEGLRSVGFGSQRAFSLEIHRDGNRQELIWDGENLRQESKTNSSRSEPHIEIGVLTDRRSRASEYQALVSRAYTCPIPLKVDGRRVDRLLPEQRDTIVDKVRGSRKFLCPLSVGVSPHADAALLPMPTPDSLKSKPKRWSLSDRFTDSRPVHTSDTKFLVCEKFWRLDFAFEARFWEGTGNGYQAKFSHQVNLVESHLHWVLDGVVLASESLGAKHKGMSLQLFLNAEGLRLDLSGFAISYQEKKQKDIRVKAALSGFARELDETAKQLKNILPKPFAGTFGPILSFLTVHGAFMIKVFPLHLTMATFFGIKSASDKKKVIDECRAALSRYRDKLSRTYD